MKEPKKPQTYNLSKDDQINCLIHIIYGLAGYGAANQMIERTYKEYMDMKDAMDTEAQSRN